MDLPFPSFGRCLRFGALLAAGWPIAAQAVPEIRLALPTAAPGAMVPADFAGLSYEMKDVLPDAAGRRLFRADNRPLIAMLRTMGIRNLRVGGNTADLPSLPLPAAADLDSLFAFARAGGLKVIFTLRLRQGDPSAAAAEAQYLMAHYGSDIQCFAIGNEPDIYDHTYPAYLADLKKYIAAIVRPGVAPAARFAGPSTTPDKAAWARALAQDAGGLPLSLITQHEYPGGSARAVKAPGQAIDAMLSADWLAGYAEFYRSFAPAAQAANLPYRLEETNNYFHGGVAGASDAQGAALWALDYLNWWALHGAAGLNFHTGDWVAAADDLTRCRYAAFWSTPEGYAAMPVGYALKAFAIGGGGRIVPVEVTANPETVNVTAYAVRGADGRLRLTVINKEHGPRARAVSVCLPAGTVQGTARAVLLTAPGHSAAATAGIRLGGAPIDEDGAWRGEWTALPSTSAGEPFSFPLPPATAVILALP